MPRYGQLNESYIASWFARDEPQEVADQLVAHGSTPSDTDYVLIADPALDDIARSLTDTSTVLF